MEGSVAPSEEPRVAVVTGGTGALGREVVRELLRRGYEVHVPWYDEGEAEELRARVGAEDAPEAGADRLHLAEADVTDAEQVERFFGPVRTDGRLDLLCNLVGGFAAAPLGETEPSTWRRMVEMNATSTFLCTRAALALLRPGGGGAVVNVAAWPALDGGGSGMSAYTAAKGSVVALTRAWARELRADGVRVNAVAPEIIDTPANRRAMPDADRSTWLDPSDIARVVAFLGSGDGRIVTGSVLRLGR